jgi:hypothetical protein
MRITRIHPCLAAGTTCMFIAVGAAIWNPAGHPATILTAKHQASTQNSFTPDAESIRAVLPYIAPPHHRTVPRQQKMTIPVTFPTPTATSSPAPSPAPPTPVSAGILTATQVGQLWVDEDGPASQETVAACVVNNESGGNSGATHGDANGTVDTGLYQINSVNAPSGEMMSPEANTAEAVRLFESEGGWLPDWVADAGACGL